MRNTFRAALLIATAIAASSRADEDMSWRDAPVTSHLRNFMVVGMPRDIALNMAIWAENTRERIEVWARMPIPGRVVYPIIISAQSQTNEPRGYVVASQDVTQDGHLRQELTVVNLDQVDGEDILDGLCHLLLNRWIHVRQSPDSFAREPYHFPRWFTCGVAQSLYPSLVERNRAVIAAEEQAGRYEDAMSAVSRVTLPPGRWPEKAHAGLVVSWMADVAEPDGLLIAAAERAADGLPLDESFVLDVVGARDAKSFNAAWDLWMARLAARIVPGRRAADTSEIARVLEMRAEDLGLRHPAVPVNGKIPPLLLIEERDQPWARGVSALLIGQLRNATIGRLPEIREAVIPFVEVLGLMLNPPPEVTRTVNKRKQVVSRPPSTRAIQKMWRRADKGWRDLVARYEDRESFVDAYDTGPRATVEEIGELLNSWESPDR